MDIIASAGAALKLIQDAGVDVRQGWYNASLHKTHVTLWNMGTTPAGHSDDTEDAEEGMVQVTIFGTTDEVAMEKQIKSLMVRAGFTYAGTDQDGTEEATAQDGIYMKPLRFRLIEETEE